MLYIWRILPRDVLFFSRRGLRHTHMAEPKATRKAERNLKKARIEKSIVTKKGVPADQQQPTKSKPSVSFSPKDKGKQKAAHGDAAGTLELSPKSELPSSFVVVAGSYEKLLYGLDGTVTSSESGHKFHLKPVFIFPAHVSSIKAVAASPNGGKWLATGSSDEIIKVWDLARRKEIGGLMHHQGMCFARMSSTANQRDHVRIYHVSPISVTLSSTLRVRGWYIVSFPCAGLDRPTLAQGAQRSRELCRNPPFWKGRTECRTRQDTAYVGFDAWEGVRQHEIRKR